MVTADCIRTPDSIFVLCSHAVSATKNRMSFLFLHLHLFILLVEVIGDTILQCHCGYCWVKKTRCWFILNENLLQNKVGVANYCLTYSLGSVNEF